MHLFQSLILWSVTVFSLSSFSLTRRFELTWLVVRGVKLLRISLCYTDVSAGAFRNMKRLYFRIAVVAIL